MAKLYIPSQSPLVRAKRGFGAPGEKPPGPVEINRSNSLSDGLVLASYFSAFTQFHDLILEKAPTKTSTASWSPQQVNFGGVVEDSYGLNFGSVAALRGASNFTFVLIDVARSAAVNDRLVGKSGYFANNNDFLISWWSNDFVYFDISNATTSRLSAAGLTGKKYTFAATYNGSTQVLYADGEERGTNDVVTFIPNDTDPLILGAWSTRVSQDSDQFSGSMKGLLVFDRALTAAQVRSISEDPYQLLRPSNQSPFVIGTVGAPPLDFDETAQIAATATVTASEQYTPPVAPSYDETAVVSASVTITANETFGTEYIETALVAATATITALETYTPPVGTDNNVWVGADRLDALAVGATVLGQAYVGAVPVLNQ